MTTYRAWNLKPLDRSALKELTAAIAQQSTEELENRAMETMDGEPWSEEKYQMTLAAQQKEAGLLAGILAARGITDPAEALTLLSGEEELTDPMLLTDMDKACARILDAIDREETIVVFGDYDVDGVTATALLYQHLKGMGANVKCMLPSREGDGYGLSKNAIQSIHDKGCQLIVTVDNGISALEEAEFAASLGVDLIVTDHHLPHDTLPKAVAVVDPRRADDTSPFKGLCGAGVAFKLCAALDGCPPEEMLDYCGDLAAVGTVADVMPLTGENRTLVKAGLHLLQHSDRPGLLALLDEVGLGGKPVTAENVSYAIAPRINAAGRMDSAVTALQLVLCEDEERAAELAHKLNEINAARQETEGEIAKAAQAQLEAEPAILEDRVILIWGHLPSFLSSMVAPIVTVALLALRPLAGIAIDPLVALSAGGIAGIIATRNWHKTNECLSYGLEKMSSIAILLIGTGALAGIIKASDIKDILIHLLANWNDGGVIMAPLSGILMCAATASTTAGATIASASFAPSILGAGVAATWGAAMINAGATVLDHLPHGSFFHATGGAVGMGVKELLKLIVYETAIGLILTISSVFLYFIVI